MQTNRKIGQTANQSGFGRKSLLFLPGLNRVKNAQHDEPRILNSPGFPSSSPDPQGKDSLTRPNNYNILTQTNQPAYSAPLLSNEEKKEKKKKQREIPGKLDLSGETKHNPFTSLNLLTSKEVLSNCLIC